MSGEGAEGVIVAVAVRVAGVHCKCWHLRVSGVARALLLSLPHYTPLTLSLFSYYPPSLKLSLSLYYFSLPLLLPLLVELAFCKLLQNIREGTQSVKQRKINMPERDRESERDAEKC